MISINLKIKQVKDRVAVEATGGSNNASSLEFEFADKLVKYISKFNTTFKAVNPAHDRIRIRVINDKSNTNNQRRTARVNKV